MRAWAKPGRLCLRFSNLYNCQKVTLLKLFLGCDKESYYPHQNHRKKSLCSSAFSGQKRYNVEEQNLVFGVGGIVPLPHPFSGEKTVAMTALLVSYLSTLQVLLTVLWINDIIIAQKNSFDADTLDGCLHFVSKFDHRTERTLTLGDLDNQNLKRRSAIDQHPFAHTHTCTLKI